MFLWSNRISVYASNIFAEELAGIQHVHAYTNSIVIVLNKVAFSDVTNSIYGHYALFYVLSVKTFRGYLRNNINNLYVYRCFIWMRF